MQEPLTCRDKSSHWSVTSFDASVSIMVVCEEFEGAFSEFCSDGPNVSNSGLRDLRAQLIGVPPVEAVAVFKRPNQLYECDSHRFFQRHACSMGKTHAEKASVSMMCRRQ